MSLKQNRTIVIAEAGVNHNGDINIAKKLIKVAKDAGCNAVKFQKRNPDVCVPEKQKKIMRETPWGYISYLDYKYKVEFEKEEYDIIDTYCKELDIQWFASPWDVDSVKFLSQYNIPALKVPSASLNDVELLMAMKGTKLPIILSTGMSNVDEINMAIKILKKKNRKIILLHCNTEYPTHFEDINLK